MEGKHPSTCSAYLSANDINLVIQIVNHKTKNINVTKDDNVCYGDWINTKAMKKGEGELKRD